MATAYDYSADAGAADPTFLAEIERKRKEREANPDAYKTPTTADADFSKAFTSLADTSAIDTKERRLSDYLSKAQKGLQNQEHADFLNASQDRALSSLYGADKSALNLAEMMQRNAGIAGRNTLDSARGLGLNEVAAKRLQRTTQDRYMRDAELEQARIDQLRKDELMNIERGYQANQIASALGGMDYRMQDLLTRQKALDALRRSSADYLLGAEREAAGLESAKAQGQYDFISGLVGAGANMIGSGLASYAGSGAGGGGSGGASPYKGASVRIPGTVG